MLIYTNVEFINLQNNILFGLTKLGLWSTLINFSILVFFIGVVWILLNWKNFLITLLCIEIMYLGLILSFIFVSLCFNDPKGEIYALILIVLAASESAIGLGLLIVLYNYGRSIDFQEYQILKG